MKSQLLKPSPENSLFICKVYFDRPNLHDPSKNQQKRFYSFDYASERQSPPRLEDLGEEQELMRYNGYRKMIEWIGKAKKDHYFKMAYIYTNCHLDERKMPMELRLFLPYAKEACKAKEVDICKPHWKDSLFRMDVYYQGEKTSTETYYSQDSTIERRDKLPLDLGSTSIKTYHGYQYLSKKAIACQQKSGYYGLILYANIADEKGGGCKEILRVGKKKGS